VNVGQASVRTINIDVSDVTTLGFTSGIQRYVRELSHRLIARPDLVTRLVKFNAQDHVFDIVAPESYLAKLREQVPDVVVTGQLAIADLGANDVFFDAESAWLSPLKRPDLYRRLKSQGTTIVNVLYDLVPVKYPDLAHENTVRSWLAYLAAIYTYSDLVLPISRATEQDFQDFQEMFQVTRHIPTVVLRSGGEVTSAGELTPDDQAALAPFRGTTYYLFVGTIEPRKRQLLAIEAWDQVRRTHPGVHLVLIGRLGWHAEDLVQAIRTHPEFGATLHWVQDASDRVVESAYQSAFATVYLTRYEGYGLPVAEALARGKIVITSREAGAVYEVAGELADYSYYGTPLEVASLMESYLENQDLYSARIDAINHSFTLTSWDTVANTVGKLLGNLERPAIANPQSLQFVYISNEPERVMRSMVKYAVHAPVKEFVVICPGRTRERFKTSDLAVPVVLLSDEEVLGARLQEFREGDHVKKNWLLRSSLVEHPVVDEVFVMLDDDSAPLRDITISDFINDDGTDNAFYFGELTRWPRSFNDYDFGQVDTLRFMRDQGLEELSYSSHQPQVIRKAVFREAASLADTNAAGLSLDEWSTYFNFAATRYPLRYCKRLFKTLNWPMLGTDWRPKRLPSDYVFENVYEFPYEHGIFVGLPDPNDARAKIAAKDRELVPLEAARRLLRVSNQVVSAVDLASGAWVVRTADHKIVVQGIPEFLMSAPNTVLKLPISIQMIACGGDELPVQVELVATCAQTLPRLVRRADQGPLRHDCAYTELPVPTPGTGVHTVRFGVRINGQPVAEFVREAVLFVTTEDVEPEAIMRELRAAPAAGAVRLRMLGSQEAAGATRAALEGRADSGAARVGLGMSRRRLRDRVLSVVRTIRIRQIKSRLRSGLWRFAPTLAQARANVRLSPQRSEELGAALAALSGNVRANSMRVASMQAEITRLTGNEPSGLLTALASQLPQVEAYQPLYGLPGVSVATARDSIDRARAIEAVLPALPGLRVLDIGSSLGYFSLYLADRGALSTGWDMRAENASVARLVSRITGLRATFMVKTLDDNTVGSIQPGQFDVVLLLSVLHHVIHATSLTAAQKLVRALVDRVPVLILELARADEGNDHPWEASLPEDPLTVLDLVRGDVEIEQLGEFPTHLGNVPRPLIKLTKRQVVTVNGQAHPFDRMAAVAYQGSTLVAERHRRRFYFSDREIIKEYRFPTLNDEGYRQALREINLFTNELAAADVFHRPRLLDFELTSRHVRLVLHRVPGELVSDLAPLPIGEVCQIADDVLHSLSDLHAAGMNHNDVRSWNIIVDEQGSGWLIDYGLAARTPVEDDAIALMWALHTAVTGESEAKTVGKTDLPPRSELPAALHPLWDAVMAGERAPVNLRALAGWGEPAPDDSAA